MSINDLSYWENILKGEGLGLLPGEEDTEKTSRTWGNAEKKCSGICSECINTYVGETQTRINLILCCKSHPETLEVSEEGFCPEVDIETGLCKVYESEEYPAACSNYHCMTHGR